MIKFLKKIQKKISNAIAGLIILFKEENSIPFYIVWLIALIILGVVFRVSLLGWALLTISFGVVVVLEVINTAIENLADQISLQYSIKIKKIKDLAACATLLMLLVAFAVDLFIFIPAIINFFN